MRLPRYTPLQDGSHKELAHGNTAWKHGQLVASWFRNPLAGSKNGISFVMRRNEKI